MAKTEIEYQENQYFFFHFLAFSADQGFKKEKGTVSCRKMVGTNEELSIQVFMKDKVQRLKYLRILSQSRLEDLWKWHFLIVSTPENPDLQSKIEKILLIHFLRKEYRRLKIWRKKKIGCNWRKLKLVVVMIQYCKNCWTSLSLKLPMEPRNSKNFRLESFFKFKNCLSRFR